MRNNHKKRTIYRSPKVLPSRSGAAKPFTDAYPLMVTTSFGSHPPVSRESLDIEAAVANDNAASG